MLEGAGLSQSAEANAGIAIDMGLLDREETLDLSQLSVQAVQLQQEEKARQEEAARQAALDAAHRTGRQAARQALLDAYDGAMATRQITVYAAPSDSAASLRTLRQGKVARLNDVTEDGSWYQITFSGTTGYVRYDACQAVQYSDYAGTSAVKSARMPKATMISIRVKPRIPRPWRTPIPYALAFTAHGIQEPRSASYPSPPCWPSAP